MMATEVLHAESAAETGATGILEQVSLAGKAVFVEIEHTQFRFRSRTVLDGGRVMIAKPEILRDWPLDATHVRLRLPGLADGELRLQVTAPRADLGEGREAFACALPGDLVKNHRNADRFAATREPDLRLEIGGKTYRLEDLSATGCRVVLTGAQQARELPLQKVLPGGNLLLGPTVWVRLVQLMPRTHHGRQIGCEFRAARDPASLNNLSALLDSLKHAPPAAPAPTRDSRMTRS